MQVNINPAVEGLNPHKYNPLSIASLDLGEIVCTKYFESEKRDEWNSVKGNGFLRLAALDFPAYGRCFVKSAAFFVPYYQILANVDGFRQGLVSDKGVPCVTPKVGAGYLNHILSDGVYSSTVGVATSPVNFPTPGTYDFVYIFKQNTDDVEWNFYKLNSKGRRVYKLAKSVGLDFRTYSSSTSFISQAAQEFEVNIYELLAYWKIYSDYFVNIHFYNSNIGVQLLRAIKDGTDFVQSGNTWYNASTGVLSEDCFKFLITSVQVPFSSNLYQDAWNSINSPTGYLPEKSNLSVNSAIGPYLPSFTYGYDNTTDDLNFGTGIKNSARIGDSFFLTQFGINNLSSFFQFLRRNKLFGSEPARTALARFGIKGDDFNALFARKLYENSQPIDFSAVMSNANTVNGSDGSFLGAYGGVGIGSFNFDYNYKCSDYGVVMNLNWIQIDPVQLHGFDPAVLRLKPFDWYTPEFDGKASRAIPQAEVSIGKSPVNTNYNLNDIDIYGFCGIYDEYRHMRDTVLGDFCVGNAKNFLFARDLGTKRGYTSNHGLQPQITAVQYYNNQGDDPSLTDPFMFSSTDGDRFYLQIIWDINASRPMMSNGDSLMLNGDGNLSESTNSSPLS